MNVRRRRKRIQPLRLRVPPEPDIHWRMRAHLIGIGGVGMSALAQALLDHGFAVGGSDRLLNDPNTIPPPVFSVLRAAGVALHPQDGSGIATGLDIVIASSAVESGNPDLVAAHRLGIPVISRAAMLARLVEGRPLIAVAGTAGKTTVTGMIGWILEQTGRDPAVVNGGELVAWSRPNRVGGVRHGSGEWTVIETDESDRSLLLFHPAWAVITNISKDHYELDELERVFRAFAAQTAEGIVTDAAVAAHLGEAGRRARLLIAHELNDLEFEPR